MLRFLCKDQNDTQAAAAALAKLLRPGDVIAYRGGMGAGKTTFTRGLAGGLGITEQVSSPTFTLINEYRGEKNRLCHVDAYRLTGGDDLVDTGFFDYVDSGWIAAVEWSEMVELDADFTVSFERIDDNTRKITIEGRGV